MQLAGHTRRGRIAMRIAAWGAPRHRARNYLARLSPLGFVCHSAVLQHPDVQFGAHIFIGDRVVIYGAGDGGPVSLGDRVTVYADVTIETSERATVTVGAETSIHTRCQLMAHKGSIRIGRGVALAAGCALYPYDHGIAGHVPIRRQPVHSKGDIVIGDEAWLGTAVIVLAGVTIGEGAVVGAGSVVTDDVPDYAIAVGVPARVVKFRTAESIKDELLTASAAVAAPG
jgi:acetyltransferase-like isoleucine patch superfamily enzyme